MSNYNLKNKIDTYNKVTEERGHGFFSDQALQLHKEKYANHEKDRGVIQEKAKAAADAFLDKARDYKLEGHEKAREQYQNHFDSNEDKVQEYYHNMYLQANGLLNMPIRNSHYEKNVLKAPKISTNDEAANHKALCDLMQAKWNAVGYDKDEAVINEFKENYLPSQQASHDKDYRPDDDKGIASKVGTSAAKHMARLADKR